MKRKLMIIIPATLLVLAVAAAAIWYAGASEKPKPPPETFTLVPAKATDATKGYKVIPDEEFYPQEYIGYRYPIRPGTELWAHLGYIGIDRLQIPEDIITGMSTEQLAQSVVCLPWYGWQAEMTLSSQSEQPPDFVRSWFDRRFEAFSAMQVLAERKDARAELEKLNGLYLVFTGESFFNGIDPGLMLQSAQFGGTGIPDNAHKGG